ncbi:MAG: DUF655 domain-containing protein [Candidatus Aenigmarchaeota archaeon]|nr:DUF655 domain-containing protein [Candidatus Aenigmarchaeota archaeon]
MSTKDEYIIVLDFLSSGKSSDRRAEPLAQGLGDKFFSLLEVVIKEGSTVKTRDRIYVGDSKREEVKYIRTKIRYSELTSYAKDMLEEVVNSIVSNDEKRFVNFFNTAGSLTTRMHSLELLPGIGKRHMWQIISERRKKSFESFEDLKSRIDMMTEPKKMIIKRIMEELKEKDGHQIFVGAPL